MLNDSPKEDVEPLPFCYWNPSSLLESLRGYVASICRPILAYRDCRQYNLVTSESVDREMATLFSKSQ